MSLYKLVGHPGMTPGTTVDMGSIGHRYGRIQSVLQTDYVLPTPCVLTGPVRATQYKGLTLYLIRGLDNYRPNGALPPVWGWSS
jgi:hypothetical protein